MIELNDMERTVLKPGDVLVLRPAVLLTADKMARLAESAKRFSAENGIKVMVVECGIDVLVASEAEAA